MWTEADDSHQLYERRRRREIDIKHIHIGPCLLHGQIAHSYCHRSSCTARNAVALKIKFTNTGLFQTQWHRETEQCPHWRRLRSNVCTWQSHSLRLLRYKMHWPMSIQWWLLCPFSYEKNTKNSVAHTNTRSFDTTDSEGEGRGTKKNHLYSSLLSQFMNGIHTYYHQSIMRHIEISFDWHTQAQTFPNADYRHHIAFKNYNKNEWTRIETGEFVEHFLICMFCPMNSVSTVGWDFRLM